MLFLISAALMMASGADAKRCRAGGYLAKISSYPGTDLAKKGSASGSKFVVRAVDGDEGSTNIKLNYKIRNGPVGTGAGVTFHIHSGVTCEDAGRVGGHYWAPFELPDPQNSGNGFFAYTDNRGKAKGVVYSDIGYSVKDIIGHTVVVHEMKTDGSRGSGPRIGCGVIGREYETATARNFVNFVGPNGELVDPNYQPSAAKPITLALNGEKSTVSVYQNADGTQSVTYLLYAEDGKQLDVNGGLHIHAGTSCADHNDQVEPFTWGMDIAYPGNKGHYYNTESIAAAEDPWSDKWVANADRTKAEGSFNLETDLSFESLANKVFVIHQGDGTKAFCAELTLDEY
jgi:Cu/Zn superoxide dismutase